MSVIVTIRIKADPSTLERVVNEQADTLERISEVSRSLGALHHCFADAGDEVLVVDEWESAEAFQGFFESNTDIPPLMEAAGVQAPPEVTIYRRLDAPGSF